MTLMQRPQLNAPGCVGCGIVAAVGLAVLGAVLALASCGVPPSDVDRQGARLVRVRFDGDGVTCYVLPYKAVDCVRDGAR